ncbi:transposase [Streptomyces sp. NPDC001514]
MATRNLASLIKIFLAVVLGDRGYDHDTYRRLVRALGVKPVIARRGTEHGSGLGKQRWVVERAFAHLHWFRRLPIRWEIRDDIHEALTLGCALICWRRLKSLGEEFLGMIGEVLR